MVVRKVVIVAVAYLTAIVVLATLRYLILGDAEFAFDSVAGAPIQKTIIIGVIVNVITHRGVVAVCEGLLIGCATAFRVRTPGLLALGVLFPVVVELVLRYRAVGALWDYIGWRGLLFGDPLRVAITAVAGGIAVCSLWLGMGALDRPPQVTN